MKFKRAIVLSILSVATIGVVVSFLIINQARNTDYCTVTFETNGGSKIDPITVVKGTIVPKPFNPTKEGYDFDTWIIKDREWDFEKDIVNQDITLQAEWDIVTYTITYVLEGGIMPETYETTYTIESEFELVRPTKDDVIFSGWFDKDGKRIDSITPGMTGDIILNATWVSGFFPISEDETKGTITVYSSETSPNEYTMVHNAVDNQYHLFKGWFDKNGTLLSEELEYTVTIDPNVNYYIYSHYLSEEEEKQWNDAHGVNPVLHGETNKTITYGMYPQTNINDSELISKLEKLTPTEFNNYYYYNHEYYAKKTARLARDLETHELLSVRQFDNGDEFEENETYWFKVEPLSWRIIKQDSSQFSLISEKLLDVRRYYKNSSPRTIDEQIVYSNNYKYSDVREWLNNDFLSNAFGFNVSPLTIMEIDNSKETTATPDSGFECENTFDYVTLLSYKDYNEQALSNRLIKTTDYVRVSGANYSVNSNNLFSGYYWTRSPIETEEENGTSVSRCNMNGTINNDFVGWGGSCVQPSITISK